ncbi:MAG TPA: hypothetical protein VIY56_13310 [Vicinamibacterales bacterium]
MAALLVGMTVMAVFMTMALPVWSTAAKRAREDELVFRGEQYARAIGLFQRKYANTLPPSIDVLVNEKFLRRKYLDPVTGGEFQALTGAVAQAAPGAGAGAGRGAPPTGMGAQGAGARGGAGQSGGFGGGQPAFGAGGGIVGVASKSTEKSLRLYNGRGAYNEWTFVPVQRQLQAGGGDGQQAPGLGGRGGNNGRGQAPGSTGARGNRPGTGSGGFRPPTTFGDGFRPGGQQGR